MEDIKDLGMSEKGLLHALLNGPTLTSVQCMFSHAGSASPHITLLIGRQATLGILSLIVRRHLERICHLLIVLILIVEHQINAVPLACPHLCRFQVVWIY